MNRREFLAAAVGAAVAVRTGRARAAAKGRVVVVGAGLAGLAAAYELSRGGWRVTVLEGRKYVGGRVRTVRSKFAQGQYAEAGAERFADSHVTLLRYVRRFGLEAEPVRGSGNALLYLQRKRYRLQQPDAPWPFPSGTASFSDPDRHSVAEVLHDNGPAAAIEVRRVFAAEPTELSLLFFLQQSAHRTPGTLRIGGGNDGLAQAFADRLSDVRLEENVTEIVQRGSGVRVNGNDADFCVLSVPLPVYRDIEFSPGLPARLAEAVERLPYGAMTTALLQYERRFWRDRGLSGTVLTDLGLGTSFEATRGKRGRVGILAVASGGEPGRVYGNVGAADRELLAADELEEVFPGSRRLLGATDSAAWAREHFSRGAFPAYAPGQVTRYQAALRQPLGRIILAGEHTDALTGTMEGALRSGRRAAAAVNALA